MANERLFEVSRTRGVVTISTILRFAAHQLTQRPTLLAVAHLLPTNWDVDDGDVFKIKEIK